MTKNKRLVSRMMLTLVVLTLVSFCCVGFTFARYTSEGSGTATLSVAKWDVTDTFGSTAVDFDQLSPAKEAFDTTAKTARTHSTGIKEVATITNNSDVSAEVTFDLTAIQNSMAAYLYTSEGAVSTEKLAAGLTTNLANKVISLEDLQKVFSITLYNGETKLVPAEGKNTVTITLTKGQKITLKAEVVWTTDLSTEITATGYDGTTADVRDTVIGQTVAKIEFTVSYKAVQGTQIPDATSGS